MKTKQQRLDVRVSQGALNYNKRQEVVYIAYIAKVFERYADRMACDVISPDGQKILNVPVETVAGLINGEPYGVFELPEVDDYVIVRQASSGLRKQVITGTFVPYLSNDFLADAVNSGKKQFTRKLLEEGTELHYKRIFKSGSTLEVKEDGTIIVETPGGACILMDEAGPGISIYDASGNSVDMSDTGMTLTDGNGNEIAMGTTSVSINGNLEVLNG